MTGLLILTMLIAWGATSFWIAKRVTKKMPDRWWRPYLQGLMLLVLIPLPLADEIIGGIQFSNLCKKNVVQLHSNLTQGRTVYLEYTAEIPIHGTWLRVRATPYRFVDFSNRELVLSYNFLRAESGVFLPGSDSGRTPILFTGECKPDKVFDKDFLNTFGLSRVENPNKYQILIK